jgi:hypothetical protein
LTAVCTGHILTSDDRGAKPRKGEKTVPRKTIYIREGDKELWEKAEELAGDSLSGLLAAALREYIAQRERIDGEMGRIIVDVQDNAGHLTKKAFSGAWLVGGSAVIDSGIESTAVGVLVGTRWAIAKTSGGRYVVCIQTPGNDYPGAFTVYEDLDDAALDHVPPDVLSAAGAAEGTTYIEELDI